MNRFVRWAPRLLIGGAIFHVAVGLALLTPIDEIFESGVVGSIPGDAERESAFWYLMTGVALLALGELARWTVRATRRIPARLGGWLLGMGVAGIVLWPASGFWLVAAVGAFALLAAREREHVAARTPRPQPHVTK